MKIYKDINDITMFLKSYIMARPKYTEKREESKIQCYNCKGFGHISNDCTKNKNVRNNTGSWRGRGRNYQSHSQRLNHISEEPINDNEENIQECNMMQGNEKESLKISHGKVNGKKVQVLRDTGCSCVIVNKDFVEKKNLINEYSLLKMADRNAYRVQKALIEIESPYYVGKTKALCFNTEYELIIGNIPGAKCFCAHEKHTQETCMIIDDIKSTRNLSNSDSENFKIEQQSELSKDLIKKDDYIEKERFLYKSIGNRDFLYVPLKFRKQILETGHESMGGHMGINKTQDRISALFYWPNMKNDIGNYVLSCVKCQRKQKVPTKVPLTPIPTVSEAFSRVNMDIIGPLPLTKKRNKYIITIIDYATRYPEAVPITNKREKTLIKAMIDIFSRVGFPKEIISDQDPSFMGKLITKLFQQLNIEKTNSTPYHPQTNGLVEKFQGTLKQMLAKLCVEKPKEWDFWLPMALFAYREVPQSTTGFSPFHLLYGRIPRGPLQLMKDNWIGTNIIEYPVQEYLQELKENISKMCLLAEENIQKKQNYQKQLYDQHTCIRNISIGQDVVIFLPTSSSKFISTWKNNTKIGK